MGSRHRDVELGSNFFHAIGILWARSRSVATSPFGTSVLLGSAPMNPCFATLVIAGVAFAATVDTPRHSRCELVALSNLSSEIPVMTVARGTFDVKMTLQPVAHATDGSRLTRYALDKRYQGDLEANATGEMLAAASNEQTSAGYVALEEVKGTLHGRRGSFILQHSGTMTRGVPTLSVSVVPDSGTEELVGLTGALKIIIEGKKHSYEFEYALPPSR